MSEILAGQMMHETGIPAQVTQSLGSTVAFDALRSGEIDVYVDYSGTIWATLMHREAGLTNRLDVLAEVQRFLRERHGILVVGGFENAYALAMRRERAERLRIRRISDLVRHAPTLSIGGDDEVFGRAE